MATDVQDARGSLLAAVLSDETFRPVAPRSLEETGLPVSMVELLVIKHLAVVGTSSGRAVAKHVCLPFGALEALYQTLRTRQLIVHTGSAPVNDYYYTLTEQGRQRAQAALATCAYAGPAPVPLVDYVLSVEAQTIRAESPKRHQLEKAFSDISIPTCSRAWARPSTRARGCSSTGRRATASRRWPGGSRCASARRSGCRRRWWRTGS
jgi:hypothetical protein